MLKTIHPKLPMRSKTKTKDFYINNLGFKEFGDSDYKEYLMLKKDEIEVHFFAFPALDVKKNYGQVYIRTEGIEELYLSIKTKSTELIHPNGHLEIKPWGQKEFAVLDPDNNLLTFGQSL